MGRSRLDVGSDIVGIETLLRRASGRCNRGMKDRGLGFEGLDLV
jgi:hypothetical protein